MPRQFDSDTLIIATHNMGKMAEFKALLAPHVRKILSARDMGLPQPQETGTTFAENAMIKALACAASGAPALADDSGLCVTALNGAPGLLSARWCGSSRDPLIGMEKIQAELGKNKDRSARFTCALVLAWPDGQTETVEGHCDGQIVWPPRGDNGHGYDPIFQPNGSKLTFAEMKDEQKRALSHRGIAMRALLKLFTP